MKKVHLLLALGALVMASCSNDEVIFNEPVVPNNGENTQPMSFNLKAKNMGRADDAHGNNLQNFLNNFGVWAIKSDGSAINSVNLSATTNNQLVMGNYKVVYDTAPANATDPSPWVYEGVTGGLDGASAQFLKYWDGSFKNTTFFAYAPYDASQVFTNGYAADAADRTDPVFTFPAITDISASTPMYMYAEAQEETNANHISSAVTVPLTFHRLLSQIEIAFHEDIPGYTVEIESVSFPDGYDAEGKAAPGTHLTDQGIVAMPTDDYLTARSEYIYSGQPQVKYAVSGYAPTVTYLTPGTKKANINFANTLYESSCILVPVASNTAVTVIPDNTNTEIAHTNNYAYSSTYYNVIPNAANCAFQFVINFKLTAIDTHEVIHVKGARVLVPSAKTAWAANTRYTYIFRITKGSSGTTTPDDPTPDPDDPPTPALYPIIFDNVKVVDLGGVEEEFPVN